MTVKISIVIPSFNQGQFIERALVSVLSQRANLHECIVMDGGSTDESINVIARYAPHLTRWVSQPDAGQADALRSAFATATGDVLHWLNSDDVLLPGALQRVQYAFDANPRMDVISGHSLAIDESDRIINVRRGPINSPRWMRWGYLRVSQPSCFFRRSLYEAVGGIDPSLHCVLDTELWYRMAGRNTRWSGVNAYLAATRNHPATKGATLQLEYRAERTALKRRYPEFTRSKLKHSVGRIGYYTSQFVTGRWWSNRRDRQRFFGRRLDDIFVWPEVGNSTPVESLMPDLQPLA